MLVRRTRCGQRPNLGTPRRRHAKGILKVKNIKNGSQYFDDTDKKFVSDINRIEDAIGDQRVAGGKRVDEYVRAKGGIQYGEQTIESIAQHPDMQVCAETLRRWWAYFRLYGQLGKEISAAYPKARVRDYYELSRLLDAVILTRDGETQEEARRRTVLETVEWISQKRRSGRLSCADVQAIVSKAIDAGSTDNVIKNNERASGKPARCSKVAKTIAFQDIGSAVDYLVNFSEPGHLESGAVPVAALGKQFNRLAGAFALLAKHLARKGDREEVREKIRSVRCILDEIEAVLGSDSITWAEDSDTGVNIHGNHAS